VISMPMNPRLLRPLAGRSLLLDRYSGASVAYSLRRLRTGYTGPVVTVRRSSDSAEANFTAAEVSGGTLAAWVGAGNDGFVRTWFDQSGNAKNAEQTTANRQPKLVSSGAVVLTPEGLPAMELYGKGMGTTAEVYSGSYSWFYVIRPDIGANDNMHAWSGMSGLGSSSDFRFDGVGSRMMWFLNAFVNTVNIFTLGLQASAVYNGSANITSGVVNLYRNLTVEKSATLSPWSDRDGDLSLFAFNAGSSQQTDGFASELIFYPSAAVDRVGVVADIRKHYGIA